MWRSPTRSPTTPCWSSGGSGTPGLAHRDIKPANVMVRDGQVVLIDPAFATVRPSPWRQAVDLANMMIILALRSSPEHVYERALLLFSPDDIAEAFASTRSVTVPVAVAVLPDREQAPGGHRHHRPLPGAGTQSRPHLHPALEHAPGPAGPRHRSSLLLLFVRDPHREHQGGRLHMTIAQSPWPRSSGPSLALPACGSTLGTHDPGLRQGSSAVVLSAQALPGTAFVPCINSLKTDWEYEDLRAERGRADVRPGLDEHGHVLPAGHAAAHVRHVGGQAGHQRRARRAPLRRRRRRRPAARHRDHRRPGRARSRRYASDLVSELDGSVLGRSDSGRCPRHQGHAGHGSGIEEAHEAGAVVLVVTVRDSEQRTVTILLPGEDVEADRRPGRRAQREPARHHATGDLHGILVLPLRQRLRRLHLRRPGQRRRDDRGGRQGGAGPVRRRSHAPAGQRRRVTTCDDRADRGGRTRAARREVADRPAEPPRRGRRYRHPGDVLRLITSAAGGPARRSAPAGSWADPCSGLRPSVPGCPDRLGRSVACWSDWRRSSPSSTPLVVVVVLVAVRRYRLLASLLGAAAVAAGAWIALTGLLAAGQAGGAPAPIVRPRRSSPARRSPVGRCSPAPSPRPCSARPG